MKPTEYQPRLFHFHGDKVRAEQSSLVRYIRQLMSYQKKVQIKERPLSKKSLNSSDVFILDLGLEIFQVCMYLMRSGEMNLSL